jgi:hypothetical protein
MGRAGVADDRRIAEWRSIAILSVGFGLVGIDRYLISTMFPTIARDLGLGYSDIGTIAGALAFAGERRHSSWATPRTVSVGDASWAGRSWHFRC